MYCWVQKAKYKKYNVLFLCKEEGGYKKIYLSAHLYWKRIEEPEMNEISYLQRVVIKWKEGGYDYRV